MKRYLLYIFAFLLMVMPVRADRVKIPHANISYAEPEGFIRSGKVPTVPNTKVVIAYNKTLKGGSYYFHVYYQNFSAQKESERYYQKMYKSSSKWSKNERLEIGGWELFYDQFYYKPSKFSNRQNDRKRLFAFYQNQRAGLMLTIISTNTGSKEDLIKLFKDFNDRLSPKIQAEQE